MAALVDRCPRRAQRGRVRTPPAEANTLYSDTGVFASAGGVLTLAPAVGGRADSESAMTMRVFSVWSSLPPFLRL